MYFSKFSQTNQGVITQQWQYFIVYATRDWLLLPTESCRRDIFEKVIRTVSTVEFHKLHLLLSSISLSLYAQPFEDFRPWGNE